MKEPELLSDWEAEAIGRLHNSIKDGKWSRAGLVSILKSVIDEVKPLSAKSYAEKVGISPQGARRFRDHILIDNKKYFVNY